METDPQSILVVKLGGTDGVDFSAICKDVAELVNQGPASGTDSRWVSRSQRAW